MIGEDSCGVSFALQEISPANRQTRAHREAECRLRFASGASQPRQFRFFGGIGGLRGERFRQPGAPGPDSASFRGQRLAQQISAVSRQVCQQATGSSPLAPSSSMISATSTGRFAGKTPSRSPTL